MPDTMMADAPLPVSANRSPEIKDLAAALVKAQAAMEGARKDKNNPHFKSAYADIASVWDAIREPLTANGLAVVQLARTVNNGVEVETMMLHTSGQYISDTLAMPAKMDAQGIGSALTYARRYSLMAIAGVAPVDDDANAAGGNPDFRPQPRQSSANGRRMAADDPHLIDSGRQKGEAPKANGNGAAKRTAAEKAKEWTDTAIGTLNLTAHTVDSLSKFWSDNTDKIEWLEGNAPDQYERLLTAYDNAAQAARAKVDA